MMRNYYLISFFSLIFFTFQYQLTYSQDSITTAEEIFLLQKNKNPKKLRYLQVGEELKYELVGGEGKQKGILENIKKNSLVIGGQEFQVNELASISGQATKVNFTKNTGQMITGWSLIATGAGAASAFQGLGGVAAIVTPVLSLGTLGAGLAGVFLLGTPVLVKQKFVLNEKWEASKAMIDPTTGVIIEDTNIIDVRPEQITFNWEIKDSEIAELVDAEIEVTDNEGNVLTQFANFSQEGVTSFTMDSEDTLNVRVFAEGYEDTVLVVDANNFYIEEVQQEIQLKPTKTEYEINITDIETDQDVELSVVLTNKERDEKITLEPKDMVEGKYKVAVRSEDTYELEVRSTDEYFFFTKEINTLEERKSRNLTSGAAKVTITSNELKIQVTALKVGAKIQLENISFAINSYQLNQNAMRELDRVVYLLEKNSDMIIEIGAHTDNVGSVQDNLVLSQNRANSVLIYLQNKGINTNRRCVAKAYGSSQPLVPNNSEANRAKNRRFEIKIIGL